MHQLAQRPSMRLQTAMLSLCISSCARSPATELDASVAADAAATAPNPDARATSARVRSARAADARAADALGDSGAARQTRGRARPCRAVSIEELAPDKARYRPGAEVTLHARVSTKRPRESACSAAVTLQVRHFGTLLKHDDRRIELPSGSEPMALELAWTAPSPDHRGYLATLSVQEGEPKATGIDVSSDSLRYPRYGYISSFPPHQTEEQSRELIKVLTEQYHLNMLQLYDWQHRHEQPLPISSDGSVEARWQDLFGRTISWATVRDIVDAAHEQHALALAYVAMYAAREGYEQRSDVTPAWGLFEDSQAEHQVMWTFGEDRRLFLMDPSNAGWQAWMASQFNRAIAYGEFDGVHIDQFGPQPARYRVDGSSVALNQTFVPFLERIDTSLNKDSPGSICVFNLVDGGVGGYAVSEVMSSSACDVLYSELWYTADTYEDLRAYAELLRGAQGERAVVFAAYAQYGEDVGQNLEAEQAELIGVRRSSDHAGFSGSGFVDHFDSPSDALRWELPQSEAATVTLVFRYANGSGASATRSLRVDGEQLAKLHFNPLSDWDQWSFDAWFQTHLEAGEHTVELAYAEGDSGAVNIDRLTLGEFDEASMRLQNAVIFASGATPIQLGDNEQSLAHEYFPNRSKSLRPSLKRALRRQYSFVTAYEELLFAPDVQPVEARLERIHSVSPAHTLIDHGTGGVWGLLRESPGRDVIHLVNLVGVNNDRWRDAAPTPQAQAHIELSFTLKPGAQIDDVSWATPDVRDLALHPLPFVQRGDNVRFQVPYLAYWDVIVVRYAETAADGGGSSP